MPEADQKQITSPERIRRIIGILRLDGREIEIHLPQYIEVAKITATGQQSFTVRLSNSLLVLEDAHLDFVYISFIFSGVELFGKCKFLQQSRSYITLDYPPSLGSRSRRRHPRAKLKRKLPARLRFRQFPQRKPGEISLQDFPIKYSKLYWEVQREKVDIKKVFFLVGKEVKNISPYSEIVFYNQSNKNQTDAVIMMKSGKVLYVDDCTRIQSYTRFIPSEKLINYFYYLNEKKLDGMHQDELVSELKKIVSSDREAGYTSKAVVPVFSEDRVIGHIKVYQKEKGKKITYGNIADLISLSTVLSTGIEKAHYIPEFDDSVSSSVVDLSEGGLLLKIGSDADMDIPEDTEIQLSFNMEDSQVTLKGNVVRRDISSGSYAVRFEEVDPQSKQKIKNFVQENIENSGKQQ
ncbi:MAG: PilZ domain-containing protein [Spirochaetota bacterium]